MRLVNRWARTVRTAALLPGLMILTACTLEAGDEAAHAIAEKFAGQGEAQPSAPSQSAPEAAPSPPVVTVINRVEPSAGGQPKLAEAPRQAAPAKAEKTEKAKAEKAKADKDKLEKAEAARRREEQRRDDEAEMLASARAEAEERSARERAEADAAAAQARADQEIRLAAKRRVEEELKAADAKLAAEKAEREEQARKAEEARKAHEALVLAEAQRREEEAQKAAEVERLAAEKQRVAEEAERAAEARRLADEAEIRRLTEAARQDQAERLAEEALRREEERRAADEAHASAERARQAELARVEAERQEHTRQVLAKGPQGDPLSTDRRSLGMGPQALISQPPITGPASSGAPAPIVRRVAVLLVMQVGNRGIRRFDKSADPILCMPQRCYVSQGAGTDAKAITRGQAFGPGVALLSRAGACNHQTACVFRNIDLEGASAELQPIDLRILRHDRREARIVSADPTCRLEGGRLTCRQPVLSSDYTLWVVPEAVAAAAGSLELQTAVQSGLKAAVNAELTKN